MKCLNTFPESRNELYSLAMKGCKCAMKVVNLQKTEKELIVLFKSITLHCV